MATETFHSGAAQIAFVFDNVAGYQALAGAFRPDVEVHVLDATGDGLEQIAAILSRRSDVEALHVVGHGSVGTLNFGSLTLDAANVDAYSDVLGRIGGALTPDGDILLYGCKVAAAALGAQFVGNIAQVTGADVAASTDATGSAARGGDWTLEFSQGQVASTNALDVAAVRSLDTLLALPGDGTVNISDNDVGNTGTVIPIGGAFNLTATADVVQDPDPADGVYLEQGTPDETITIEAAQFSSFDLTGMTWVKYFDGVSYDGAYTFNITGYKLGGGTVTTSFSTVDNSSAYSPANYAQFTNITKFTIQILTTSLGDKPSSNTFDLFSIANADNVPLFANPSTATWNLTQNGVAFDLKPSLTVNDADAGQTLSWTQGTGPAHGTLNISGVTAASGSNITPGGTITYTPATGFAGEDTFTINVSDGIRTATKTFTMLVEAAAPSTPDLVSTSDTGISNTDNVTNASALSFTGAGAAGDSTTRVRVFIDQNGNGAYDAGEINGTTTMNNGSWTVSGLSASGLAENTYSVLAQTEVDTTSGATLTNGSMASPLTIDRTAPTATITSDHASLTVGQTATVTFTFSEDPGATFTWNGSSGDVVVGGGALSAVSGTGATRTAVFTPTANTDNGTASITIAAGAYTDAAGNNGAAGTTLGITFDTEAPTLTIGSDKAAMDPGDTAAITFTFSEDPGATFSSGDVTVSGGTLSAISGAGTTRTATFTAGGGSTASINVDAGAYSDPAGNAGAAGASPIISLDATPPNPPSAPVLESASDTGTSSSDHLTKLTTPTLSGTAEAGATVKLYDGATLVGAGAADGSGAWSITTDPLAEDGHSIVATATDTAGNTGAASGALDLTIDNTAPTLVITSDKTALHGGETAAITFTFSEDPGSTFSWEGTSGSIAVSGGTLSAISGTGHIRTAVFTPGADVNAGAASITVASSTYTDAAGNDGGAGTTPSIHFDTRAPTVTIGSDKAALHIAETAVITFTFSEDPGATFSWDGSSGDVVVSGGTLSAVSGSGTTRTAVFTPTANTNGGHASITVTTGAYTDAAGNSGGAGTTPSLSFDTLAPNAPSAPVLASASDTGTSSSDHLTRLATPTFTGTAEAGATVALYDTDGATVLGSTTADGSGDWSITSSTLSDGAHDLSVTATDAAGNVSSHTLPLTVTIDTTPPAGPSPPDLTAASDTGASNTDDITTNTHPTFTGTADAGAIVNLYDTGGTTLLGTTTADGSGDWSITSSTLSTGSHTITAKMADAAGNLSAASSGLAVTLEAPAPPPDTDPPPPARPAVVITVMDGGSIMTGNAEDNFITASGGADTVSAGGGNDTMIAGTHDDVLQGNAGNDRLASGAGADVVYGGQGNDYLQGNTGGDLLFGDRAADTVLGGQGMDTIQGGQGDDYVSADLGDDIARGGQGDDQVFGRDGDDFLSGDLGSDTLTGGAGADTFHSFGAAGIDLVTDFNLADGDRVMLDPGTSYTVTQVGADVHIDMAGGGALVLAGVQLTSLTGDWIIA